MLHFKVVEMGQHGRPLFRTNHKLMPLSQRQMAVLPSWWHCTSKCKRWRHIWIWMFQHWWTTPHIAFVVGQNPAVHLPVWWSVLLSQLALCILLGELLWSGSAGWRWIELATNGLTSRSCLQLSHELPWKANDESHKSLLAFETQSISFEDRGFTSWRPCLSAVGAFQIVSASSQPSICSTALKIMLSPGLRPRRSRSPRKKRTLVSTSDSESESLWTAIVPHSFFSEYLCTTPFMMVTSFRLTEDPEDPATGFAGTGLRFKGARLDLRQM